MPIIRCPLPGCDFDTGEATEAIAVAILNAHTLVHSSASYTGPARRNNCPKLDRPRIEAGISREKWNAFIRRWQTFKDGSDIDEASAPRQLLYCADEALGDIILRAEPNFTTKSIADAISTMMSFAVVAVARSVLRSELAAMRQSADEPFRNFAAKVRGKAETCEFRVTCTTCSETVYYTDEAIRDVLLNAIADDDIRREALGAAESLTKTVPNVIAFVEGKEIARDAHPTVTVSAASSYRRVNLPATTRTPPPRRPTTNNRVPTDTPGPTERAKTAPCPVCSKTFHLYTQRRGGWNRTPHERCIDCWRSRQKRPGPPTGPESSAINADQNDAISQVSSIYSENTTCHKRHRRPHPTVVTMTHTIFRSGKWRRAQFRDHPRIRLKITADKRPAHSTDVDAAVDSGAQANVWSLHEYLAAGFLHRDLSKVVFNIKAANKSPIPIEGAFYVNLQAKAPDGTSISAKSVVYISSAMNGFYLSFDSMLDLGIISRDFPIAGSAHDFAPLGPCARDPPSSSSISPALNLVRVLDEGCINSRSDRTTCDCPQRQSVPIKPAQLPFSCVPGNNEKMKAWLLQHFMSSTFNTCPHRALPCMTGPPIEIHLDPAAKPRTSYKAAPVPAHWHQRVHEDILRDEALGVLERVPYGEAMTWCHRMVITRKHDGSPRRTVDLSPLNRYCYREIHPSETPFHVARRIPRQTWKTVTDAWNGYHSVPLRPSDRHLTTFITPWGLWRYARAPQGFLSSGDGYNRRFDAILANFERQERIVDDNIHYDTDLTEHWWRTIELLSLLGSAGVVINPDKFQFAQRQVDYAGFRISEDRIDPLPKYLDAIRDFPVPKSTTDIRSWFGLVNQVANYGQLRDVMAPFRPFLSPKVLFHWAPDLNRAFEDSKLAIVNTIRNGVEIFDTAKITCLRTDWSQKGIGYFLMQQHCNCASGLPDCCTDGWRTTLAGSRFLSSAEQRYAPIEGEALAIAWSLEQTRFFTQGCEKLLIVTDHKPLTKIFGDRTLDEITNTRLFRLKQRTLPWHFSIAHLPGKTNLGADATSRHPSGPCHDEAEVQDSDLLDQLEPTTLASIQNDAEKLTSITWQDIARATRADQGMRTLLDTVCAGFPDDCRHNQHTASYWRYRESLYASEGVVLYEDRVVIPPSLRKQVAEGLHAAHQGTAAMEMRARAIIFWPGMTEDISRIRASCTDCIRNAPSQASIPSTPATPPSTPFEQIFADFFEHSGHHYLIVGDRLSGWTEIFSSPSGTMQAGANGLVRHLRRFFSTFGVPDELASDGGPEFSSSATREFLTRWGVHHRVSSAYNPQSNGRAEVAVKSAKRLLRSNIGPSGSLDNDSLLRAMLQLRNTPDPDCELSPAQIIFGKPLRDAFAFVNRLEKYSNPHIRPTWRNTWREKESALRSRFCRSASALNTNARPLAVVRAGTRVYLQNGSGNFPNRWDRSGVVVEKHDHDSYLVKVDGSGRLTRRNRKHLRNFEPASTEILRAPTKSSVEQNTHITPSLPPCTDPADAWRRPSTPPPSRSFTRSASDVSPTKSFAPADHTPTEEKADVDAPTPSVPDHPVAPPTSPAPTNRFRSGTEPTTPPRLNQPMRPKRNARPPARYDAASGKWT